jgi:DNA-binding transcriptional ArsR family regulator
LSEEISEVTINSEVKMKQVHELYLRAINNPLRRKILSVLKENNFTIEELAVNTCLDEFTLRWHLNVLESGLCVKKEDNKGNILYKLTQFGKVVDYME